MLGAYALSTAWPKGSVAVPFVEGGRDAVGLLIRAEVDVLDAAVAASEGDDPHAFLSGAESILLLEDRLILALTGALPSEVWS
jgi:hypothetical protein